MTEADLQAAIYNFGASASLDAYYHDIVSGNNGTFSAGVGYDEVTGLGTPKGIELIPALVSTPASALPAPVISPNGGSFTSTQAAFVTDSNPSASIYYTPNGTIPTASSTLYPGQIIVRSTETIKAIAIANGYLNSPIVSATITVNIPGNAHTFAAGLCMISVPTDYSGQSLSSVLGYTSPVFAVWEPTADMYSVTPTPPANSMVAGQGYWVRLPATETITTLGTSPQTPFTISISAGWNMIGCPQMAPFAVSALTVVDTSNASHTFAAAASSGIVQDPMYTFQAGDTNYEVVTGASGSLTPYDGYWLYASQPCTLVFPAGL